ncbi:uncharacterized protein LOC111285511 [Durio zibethinus]|uniref:Uncharacterized protein LOC111285511 n=1 Tax=Durio zibethinus TaxID=66656 RepID=A0A6P5XSA2_DURZI|nr:uncharacterized protein LOC111285511 [Durio zibethinus]
MAARKQSDDRKFCSSEKQQYLIFDRSNRFITAFCSRPQGHYINFDRLKREAIDALENTRADKRTKSLIDLDTLNDDSMGFKEYVSDDVKSDAESLFCFQRDEVIDVSDDEQCLNNLFHDEGTRKKLKQLAGMVGADGMEPGIVLAKVVTVLKELSRNGC